MLQTILILATEFNIQKKNFFNGSMWLFSNLYLI